MTDASPDRGAAAGALADRFFTAVSAGDVEALRGLYAPDAVIWHNDGNVQDVDQNLAFLSWLIGNTKSVRFEDRRTEPTPDGFVEQHVLRGTTRDGVDFEASACLVFQLAGDRIARMDEYLDPGALAPIGAMFQADNATT